MVLYGRNREYYNICPWYYMEEIGEIRQYYNICPWYYNICLWYYIDEIGNIIIFVYGTIWKK